MGFLNFFKSKDSFKSDFKRAIKLYEQGKYEASLNINPDNVDAYFLKGVALSELKSYDKALKCFDKSLKLDPDNEKVKMVRQELLSKIN